MAGTKKQVSGEQVKEMKGKKNKNFNKEHRHGISTQLNLTPPHRHGIFKKEKLQMMGLVVNLEAIEFDSSNRLCQFIEIFFWGKIRV